MFFFYFIFFNAFFSEFKDATTYCYDLREKHSRQTARLRFVIEIVRKKKITFPTRSIRKPTIFALEQVSCKVFARFSTRRKSAQ